MSERVGERVLGPMLEAVRRRGILTDSEVEDYRSIATSSDDAYEIVVDLEARFGREKMLEIEGLVQSVINPGLVDGQHRQEIT